MKKHMRYKSYPETQQDRPAVEELVARIQQQLISLERKVDVLISRTPGRPFEEKQRSYREAGQDRNRSQRPLYKAVCADCNRECEVPFRPSQDRPVYCKECFAKRKTGGSFRINRDNRPAEKDFTPQAPFDKLRKKPASKKKKNKNRRK